MHTVLENAATAASSPIPIDRRPGTARSNPRVGTLCFALLILTLGWPAIGGAETAHLPTPYTAAQIRDAWVEGLTVTTSTSTPEGEQRSRTVVTEWSEAEVGMTDQPIHEDGRPAGDATAFTATWDDLRDHARFPATLANRERATETTPLGALEGWRYTLRHAADDHSVFFFADRFPGPPVVFFRFTQGEVVMRAEMIERAVVKTE